MDILCEISDGWYLAVSLQCLGVKGLSLLCCFLQVDCCLGGSWRQLDPVNNC